MSVVDTQTANHVARVTLQRPHVRNALDRFVPMAGNSVPVPPVT